MFVLYIKRNDTFVYVKQLHFSCRHLNNNNVHYTILLLNEKITRNLLHKVEFMIINNIVFTKTALNLINIDFLFLSYVLKIVIYDQND